MGLLIRLVDEEANTNKQENSIRKPVVAAPNVLILLLALMGVLVFGKGTIFSSSELVSNEAKEINFTDTSSEIHDIMVKPSDYSPNNLLVKAGSPSIINFKTEKVGCTGIVLSVEFNVRLK